jgi:Na+-transporting NADH:ubiquinone oxidoreductase subunit C
MGVWDVIEGIVVLTPDLSRIVNITFLEHKETPGLGARIEEKWFTDQFRGISIAWEEEPDKRIVIGPSKDLDATNRVDAITGASQTSLALNKLLNSELEHFRTLYFERIQSAEEIRIDV